MNLRTSIHGIAALVLVSLAGAGCVAQTDSEADESVGTAEEAFASTTACPQGPGPVLVSTRGTAPGVMNGLYDDACASTSLGRRIQYGLNISAPTDLGVQCRDYCTDGGRFAACGIGWRLDSALGNSDVMNYSPPGQDTSNLIIFEQRPLLGQSLSLSQEVTCLDRPNVNAAGDDDHQWVAICSCSNL